MKPLSDHVPFRSNDLPRRARRGVAAVELAICAPLLVLLVLGVIDVGRYINVGMVVNAASREGARKAVRYEVTTVSQVEDGVYDYLGDHFSTYTRPEIQAATTITVTDGAGNPISDLAMVSEGAPINVEVVFNYGTVRWLVAMPFLDGRNLRTKTTMRRQ